MTNGGRQRFVCVWQMSQQVDDFFEQARLRNTHWCTFYPSKKTTIHFLLALFQLSLIPDSREKAQRRTAEKAQSGSLGEVGRTTMWPFSLQENQHHNFGSAFILASALHGLRSAQSSPGPCATVRYRATLDGAKLPGRAKKKLNETTLPHNQLQPRFTLDK